MTDPAIEAAQRAWCPEDGERTDFIAAVGINAAREAHEEIRELHKPIDLYLWANAHCARDGHDVTNDTNTGDDVCLTCTANDGGPTKACEECFDNDGSRIDWPCATAKKVYTSDELTR